MRIRDYIFLARTNLNRRKKSVIVNTILIIFSIIVFILSLSFANSLNKSMKKMILNNISYRTIVVSGGIDSTAQDTMEALNGKEHIVKVLEQDDFSFHSSKFFIDNKAVNNGSLSFLGASHDISPNVIYGRNLKENEKNVCIVPKEFYPYYDESETYDKNRVINSQELIGKTIEIKYNSYYHNGGDDVVKDTFSKTFEIVGIYDTDETINNMNECYIAFEDIKEINDIIEENSVVADNVVVGKSRTVFAIVDNSLNMENVINQLQSMNFDRVMPRSVANTDLVNIVTLAGIIVTFIIMAIVIFNLVISSIKSIEDRSYEFGMLSAIGYKNTNIKNIIYTENIIIGIISYIIAIVLVLGVSIYVKNKIIAGKYELELMNFNIDFIICLIALAMSFLVTLIAAKISSTKALKKTIIQLNKER